MLVKDDKGTLVRTKTKSVFPKGTIAKIIACEFIGNTSTRAYLIQAVDKINGFEYAADWYLERDLENVD